EAVEFVALDGEAGSQHVAFLRIGFAAAGRADHPAERRVAEHRRVEARGFFGLGLEPEPGAELVHSGLLSGLRLTQQGRGAAARSDTAREKNALPLGPGDQNHYLDA